MIWDNLKNQLYENEDGHGEQQVTLEDAQDYLEKVKKTVVTKEAAEWENISKDSLSLDEPETSVDFLEEQQQTHAQTKTVAALESSEDVSEPENHFTTYQYSDGRQCIKYRLVMIGKNGNLEPYAKDKIFINTDMAEELIRDHAAQLTIVSYDDLVHQAAKEKFGYPKDTPSFPQEQPSPSAKKKSNDYER